MKCPEKQIRVHQREIIKESLAQECTALEDDAQDDRGAQIAHLAGST